MRSIHLKRLSWSVLMACLVFTAHISTSRGFEVPKNFPKESPAMKAANAEYSSLLRWGDENDVKPRVYCYISAGERDHVVKAGTLLELRSYPQVTGLSIHVGPRESDIDALQHYSVTLEEGVFNDIAQLTQIEHLELSGVDLSHGDRLKVLDKLENLERIWINGCHVGLKDILAHLPACKNLQTIKIWNHFDRKKSVDGKFPARRVVTFAEIDELVSGSPQLANLLLQSTEQYEPNALKRFLDLKNLSYVRLGTISDLPKELEQVATPQQQAAAKTLEAAYEKRGLIRHQGTSTRVKQSFRISHDFLAIGEN